MTAETSEIRVHAYLAGIGIGSRREIERKIKAGHIQVNGRPAKLGQRVDPRRDIVRIDGRNLPVSVQQNLLVLAVFKPRGVVTTLKDPEGRPTIRDLVPKNLGRLFPVGRLDLMSEGLVIMTNDGELANHLMHPRYEISKVYEVKIRGNLDESKMQYLERGVKVAGQKWKPAEILDHKEVTEEGLQKFKVTIRVFEGKNHHVRKLFEALKCRVIRLKRIAMGPVTIKGIPRGRYKILSPSQVARLRRDVGLDVQS